VFDEQFAANLRRRYQTIPTAGRPPVYPVATSPEHESTRLWINEALARIPQPGRSRLFGGLRSGEFITAFNEVAVAAALQDAGLSVEYEPVIGAAEASLSPDFTVREPFQMIVEVWTRETRQAQAGGDVVGACRRPRQ
jgi:hypothetical protein